MRSFTTLNLNPKLSFDSTQIAPSQAGLATERIYSAKWHIEDVCARRTPRRTAGCRPGSGAPENVDDFSGWQLSGVACPAGLMTIPGESKCSCRADDRMPNRSLYRGRHPARNEPEYHLRQPEHKTPMRACPKPATIVQDTCMNRKPCSGRRNPCLPMISPARIAERSLRRFIRSANTRQSLQPHARVAAATTCSGG